MTNEQTIAIMAAIIYASGNKENAVARARELFEETNTVEQPKAEATEPHVFAEDEVPKGEPDAHGIIWSSSGAYITCRYCHENDKRWGYSVKKKSWYLYERTGAEVGARPVIHFCKKNKHRDTPNLLPGPGGQPSVDRPF